MNVVEIFDLSQEWPYKAGSAAKAVNVVEIFDLSQEWPYKAGSAAKAVNVVVTECDSWIHI